MIFLKTCSKSAVHRIVIALFALLMIVNVALAGAFNVAQTANASSENPVVRISGTKNYAYAFSVLTLVNQERAAEGLSPLTMDKNMTEQAMERAAQVTLFFEHQLPSGGNLLQIMMSQYPSAYGSTAGENIALNQSSPSAVMTSWMNSSGHKANILNGNFKTIGIGYFEGGWVQLFGGGTATTFSQPSNKSASYDIEIDESICPINIVLSSSASVTLEPGKTVTRTVKMRNSSLTSKQMTILNADWSSSNTSVATVSNGTVTAVAPGKATITAKVGSKSLSFEVVVPVRPTAVNISKTSMTINVGKVDQLSATVVPSGTGIGITWSSSNTAVAQVSSDGYVTANGIGTCTITASAGSYASASCTVTVLSPATAVEIGAASLELEKGSTHKLSASLTPSNSTDSVTWASSDTSVVTVSQSGLITAVGTGKATVTATASSGKKDSVAVTVTSRCTDIIIPEDSISMKLMGGSHTVNAQYAPIDCTDEIIWSIDGNAVSIAPNGASCVLTSKSVGTATLTVTCGNYSDSVTVTVYNAITALELPSTASVINGGKLRLDPTVTPEGADSVLTWTSSDTSKVTVDQNGVVTAVGTGKATVTVSADGVSASCVVTVYEPASKATGIALNDETVSVKKGSAHTLGYTFTPAGSEAVVTWTSSDENVAIVDIDGTVTALSDGTAVITASIDGASDSCTVTVYTPVVYIENISFLKTALTVNIGTKTDLSVNPGFSASPIGWNETITWTSSDSSVVSVENGVITAKSCGTAVITAETRDCSASLTVTVESPCTGVSFASSSYSMLNGEKITLNAVINPSTCSDEIIWASSDNELLTLTSQNGKNAVFTANKRGTYTVTVSCGNYSAQCTVTVASNPALDPGKPSASIQVLGYTSLNVLWTEVDNCDGYEVERASSAAGPFTKMADMDASLAPLYRHNSLTFNRTYYFRVRGYKLNADGTRSFGEWSDIVSGKPVPVLSGLKASTVSYNSVKLTWTKNSTANGYYIYRSADDGVTWKLLKTITKNSTVSWTNTSLTPGTTYLYKVIPYRTSGKTKVKGVENVVSYNVIPSKPTTLSVSVSSSKPKLTWTKVSGAQGYEIWRSDSYDGDYICVATITSGSAVTWTDVRSASNVYYKVRAYRGTDYGTAYSAYTSVATASTTLGKPTVFASSASYSSIKVSWHKVTGAAGYKIYRSSDGVNFSLVKTISGTTTLSWTNTGLTTGKTYYYYVVPYTSSMIGTASDTVTAVPALSKPTLSASASSYYIKLSWGKISGATGYNLYRSTDGVNFELYKQITSGSTVSYSNTSVVRGLEYYYRIAAVRNGVEGPLSSVKSYTPTLAVPSSVKASRASAESIKITWKKVSGATGYEILRSTSKTGTFEVIAYVDGNAAVAYTDTGLESQKTYYYKVRSARTLDGFTGYSKDSSAYSAKTSLYAPSTFKVSNAGYKSIKLSWSAASCADGYIIYRATSKSGTYKEIARVDGNTLNYTDTGLTTNKYYYYKIKTLHNNPSGTVYSSASSYKSAKTALQAPTSVELDYSPEYIGIFWAVEDEATGYQIYRSTKKSSGYTRQCSYADSDFVEYNLGDDIYFNTPYRIDNVRFIYLTNVSASKTYYFKIRSVKNTGTATYYSSYVTKSVKTAVQTPKIQQVVTLDDGTSIVAFYDATGAHDYAIYRATSKSGTYTNVTSQCEWYYDEETGLNMFVAPTPTNGKTYYFKVRGIYYGSKKTYYSSYSAIKSVVA